MARREANGRSTATPFKKSTYFSVLQLRCTVLEYCTVQRKKRKERKNPYFSLLTLCWLAAADGPFPSYLHASIHCAAGSHGRSSQKGERSQKAMGKRDPFRSLGFRTMTDSLDDIYPYSFSPPSRPNQNQKKKVGEIYRLR